jgi:tRNA threonylcarbamoyladenosine biosynthesis protein TsaE
MQEVLVGTVDSKDARHTHALGRLLGELLAAGHVLGLVGDLGAGKTCLTQGIAEGLGVQAGYRVTSPTFTLINEYPGRHALAHIDLYRLADEDEIWDIGVPDYMGGDNVCVVEWFDRCAGATPPAYLRIDMNITVDESRRLIVSARGRCHTELAQAWLAKAQSSR